MQKERALSIDGELAFHQAYYFFIIESKGKEGEMFHLQDMETEMQRVGMVFPKHTVVPRRSKSTQLFPTAQCHWAYHRYQMADV